MVKLRIMFISEFANTIIKWWRHQELSLIWSKGNKPIIYFKAGFLYAMLCYVRYTYKQAPLALFVTRNRSKDEESITFDIPVFAWVFRSSPCGRFTMDYSWQSVGSFPCCRRWCCAGCLAKV